MAEAARFNVIAAGRRFGKSIFGEDRLNEKALAGQPVAWFSPTYKMLAEIWRDEARRLRPVTARVNVQEHRLELVTNGLVDMWSLDAADTVRGRKYGRVVIDEAAMVPNLMDIWNAVIRPTLVDLEGDAYFLSTPRGHNAFWQLYQWGQDPARHDWRSWRFPTLGNPYIKPEEVESQRHSLPERIFAQEYLAEFMDDAGGVFRKVMDAATASEQPPQEGHQYCMGVDWGKHEDFTVLSVIDIGERRMVACDRFNQIDYAFQVGRLKALAERYRPEVIMAEANSMGEPIIERLQRDGLPVRGFTTTNATKAQIIEALSLAFERGELTILNDPVLVGELQAYERDKLPSGMVRYSAPDGMHDDTVMSLALAYSAAEVPSGASLVASW